MKYNFDQVERKPESNQLTLHGWVFDQIEPNVDINVQADQPIKSIKINRREREDLFHLTPFTHEAGFHIEVELEMLKDNVTLEFKTEKESKKVSLNLNKKRAHRAEKTDSKSDFLQRSFDTVKKIKSYGLKNSLSILRDSVRGQDFTYNSWMKLHDLKENPARMKKKIEKLKKPPTIFIMLTVENVAHFRKTLISLMEQNYPYWKLVLSVPATKRESVERILSNHKVYSDRILFKKEAESNPGDLILLLRNGTVLSPYALYKGVMEAEQGADLIYGDDDILLRGQSRVKPYFKSDYAPDTLVTNDYIGNLLFIDASVFKDLESRLSENPELYRYQAALIAGEEGKSIHHIDQILSHTPASLPRSLGPSDRLEVVQAYFDEIGRANEVVKTPDGGYNVLWDVLGDPLVSVIIPTRDNPDILRRCIDSIFEKTDYTNFEVLVADNGSVKEETLKIFKELTEKYKELHIKRIDIPFNYSRINNLAVEMTDGEYLLFLNDDTEVLSPCWMRSMLGFAQQPYAGAVGAKLLYPDRRIQHAGVILGYGGVAGHIFSRVDEYDPGYFGNLQHTTNFSAVTAACLMVARSKFEEIGGFDEDLEVAFNDVELCIKLVDKGYLNIYDPEAVLLHYESISRGFETTNAKKVRFQEEIEYIQKKWPEWLFQDPMYNTNLTRVAGDYSLRVD